MGPPEVPAPVARSDPDGVAEARPRPPGSIDLRALPPPSPWDQLRLRLAVPGGRANAATALGGVAALVAVALLAWTLLRPEPPRAEDVLPMATSAASPSTPGAVTPGTTQPTQPTRVVVHAAGAVVTPGVYTLAPGARVADLIDAAGGLTADADPDRLNLAQPLADGTRVYVPRDGEDVPPEVTVVGTPPVDAPTGDPVPTAPVDLNTAGLEELDALPGVGPTTAQAIIDHRDMVGPFRSVDELLDVRGIGDAKLEQLRPLVTVGGP